MGRVKLEIKKIENITNRQVTFSKRRTGLIKKAYELSVLCDVDIALLMFSPSGRLSAFSGNKSVEDVVERYLRLPENDRGRLHNQEVLQKVLGRAKSGDNYAFPAKSQVGIDSQIEVVQQEIIRCRSIMEDMERRLRVFEGEITTLCEAEHREYVLMEALERVRLRKKIFEYSYQDPHQATQQPQVDCCPETTNINTLIVPPSANSGNYQSNFMFDWLPPQREPSQVHILNFMGSNVVLQPRDETRSMVEMMKSPSMPLLNQHHHNLDHHNDPECKLLMQKDSMSPNSGLDVLSPLPTSDFYHTGSGSSSSFSTSQQPDGPALLELFLSQFTPT